MMAPFLSKTMARELVVPWSRARMYCSGMANTWFDDGFVYTIENWKPAFRSSADVREQADPEAYDEVIIKVINQRVENNSPQAGIFKGNDLRGIRSNRSDKNRKVGKVPCFWDLVGLDAAKPAQEDLLYSTLQTHYSGIH